MHSTQYISWSVMVHYRVSFGILSKLLKSHLFTVYGKTFVVRIERENVCGSSIS